MNVFRRSCLAGCLLVGLSASAVLAQDAPVALDAYVPADALMELYYQGVAGAEPGFKGTALMDIVNEPQCQEFGKEVARFTDLMLSQNLPDPNIMRWKDVRMFMDCEAILIVINTGQPQPKAACVVRPHGKPDDLKAFIERISGLVGGGQEAPTVRVEGIEFIKYGDAHIGWSNGDLLICANQDVVKRLLETRDGKAPGLSGDAAYKKLAAKVAKGPEFVRFYLDMDAFIKMIPKDEEQTLSVIKKLGIDSCSKVYAGIIPDAPGVKLAAYLYMPNGVSGIWKAMPRQPLDEKKLLGAISQSSSSVTVCRLGLGDLVEAINLVLSVQKPITLNDLLKQQAGFDVLGELGQSLGDEMTFDVVGPGFVTIPEFYMVIPVKDKVACRKTLDKLGATLTKTPAPDTPLEPGDHLEAIDRISYKGATIEAVKITAAPIMFTPSFMLLDDKLVIAAVPQTLKKYLDRRNTDAKSLLDNPFYGASRSHVAANPAFISYTDPRRGFESIYGGLVTFCAQMANGIPGAPPHNLATRLPSSDAITPHLLGSVVALSYDGDGFLLESYDTMGGMFSGCNDSQIGGAAQIGILAGFMLPALAKAQGSARTAACLNNIRQIGLAMIQYSGDNDEKFPESLSLLLKENYLISSRALHCPDNRRVNGLVGLPQENFQQLTADQMKKIDEASDYEIAKGVTHAMGADLIIVYEKSGTNHGGKRNCVFNDGHVQLLPEAEFQRVMKAQQDRLAGKGGM